MIEKEKITIGEMAFSFFREHGHIEVKGVEKQILYSWRGDFYRWENGVYLKIERDEVEARLVFHLNGLNQVVTTNLLTNVKLNLRAQTLLNHDRVPNTWITEKDRQDYMSPDGSVVTESGILLFKKDGSFDIKPNTPDFFVLGKLPYEYRADAKCLRWMRFLNEVTGGNKELQRMLQQWAGYLLVPTQEYQSFMLLLGEAATGKGTFTRALMAMLGRENCSSVPLRRFTNNFSLYLTYGKKLNVAGDAEEELNPQAEAVIKTWTGEDGLDFERKYADGFSAQATAKLMILANTFPTFTDKSMGTWRRLKVVPFDREDREYMESDLDEQLEAELPGILNWAILGLQDLKANRGFVQAEVSKNLWEAQKEGSNPAAMFLKENYYWEPGSFFGVKTKDVYSTYRKWCAANGYSPMSNRTFGREVFRYYSKIVKRRLGAKSRYHIYSGLKLRNNAEVLDLLQK